VTWTSPFEVVTAYVALSIEPPSQLPLFTIAGQAHVLPQLTVLVPRPPLPTKMVWHEVSAEPATKAHAAMREKRARGIVGFVFDPRRTQKRVAGSSRPSNKAFDIYINHSRGLGGHPEV
jgi:hypothetical protein